jgi:hypothetical protein
LDASKEKTSNAVNIHTLFKPVPVQPSPDDINLGEEIAGKINKQSLLKHLNKFFQSPEIRQVAFKFESFRLIASARNK